MKLLIASDIHGSLHYTKKLMEIFRKEKPDKLILLGDLLYHGPRNPLTRDYNPSEVAALLNEINGNIIAVRGNCDSEVDQMVLDFPMMSDYTQVVVDNRLFFMTHGHIYSPDNLPKLPKGSVFMSGHIHIPVLEVKDDVYILNPSSISLPKENNPSTYAIYEEGVIEIKTFEGETIRSLKL